MSEELKVFGVWGSPFSKRVEFALKLKGIPYGFIEEDITNKSELLLKYNPIHKKIPVLVHKGKPIPESVIILQYIEETWKENPLLPEDAHDRAIALFWAKFIDEKVVPSTFSVISAGENREKAVEEACGQLQILENELKNKKFFGGDQIGFVDIVACFIAFWLRLLQEVVKVELLTKEKFPLLFQWSEEFVNHSVIKENLPPRDKLFAYFQGRFGSK